MKKLVFLILAVSNITNAAAQSYDSLDINNIHAGFNAAGDMFYNINTGNGHITVPGNGIGYSVANLWIGGLDGNGQLHLAAQTYRQTGTDFWPGPLDTATSFCSGMTDSLYNKVWKLSCAGVDSFLAYTQGNPPPGYTVPADIQTWPGNGDPAFAQGHYLAPFVDVDADGVYNWQAGDYPVVYGTQSLFYIYNDRCDVHSETGAPSMGLEIHAIPYAFAYTWDDALMNTIFIHYTIINRAPVTYYNTRVGYWSDIDLAGGSRSASDSVLGAYYQYSPNDASGIVFLDQPMVGCISYENNFSATGNPANSTQYYNYLRQQWTDGTPLTSGGNGYGGTTNTNWIYSGDPVTGTGWNDAGVSDGRMLGTTGDIVFQPGMYYSFDVALVFAHDTLGGYAAVQAMRQRIQQVKSFYAGQSPVCTPGLTSAGENHEAAATGLFPNPASGTIGLTSPSAEPQPYSIFDTAGRLLLNGTTSGYNTAIDIRHLPAGIYFLHCGNAAQRFVKSE